MSNVKISGLSSASTPLTGSEIVPLNQSGVTVSATIANVQAAPVAAGTANGIQYLNASKVPTTGTNFTFDGATVTINSTASGADGVLTLKNTGSGLQTYQQFINRNNYSFQIGLTGSNTFTPVTNDQAYAISYAGNGIVIGNYYNKPLVFVNNNTEIARFDTSGNLVPKSAGTGINFTANTPASGMTSLL
jgi:hypothetical protein